MGLKKLAWEPSRGTVLADGVLLLAGLVMLIVGAKIWVDGRQFLATAVPSTGEVIRIVEVHEISSRGEDNFYYPTVRFVTPQEDTIVFEDSGSVDPEKVRVGDRLPVLYDPANPNNARLDSAMMKWGWAAIFFSMGLFFTVVSSVILYAQIRALQRIRSANVRSP